jgi:hypothetical protein
LICFQATDLLNLVASIKPHNVNLLPLHPDLGERVPIPDIISQERKRNILENFSASIPQKREDFVPKTGQTYNAQREAPTLQEMMARYPVISLVKNFLDR